MSARQGLTAENIVRYIQALEAERLEIHREIENLVRELHIGGLGPPGRVSMVQRLRDIRITLVASQQARVAAARRRRPPLT